MPEYKVSVVIPVYNAEKTVKNCIDSVLAQTLKDVQIILVDDGSTDGSAQILDSYSLQKDIVVVHQCNGGVSVARNTGIEKAEGAYIFFLDSDDVLDCDVLEKLWLFASENDLDLTACSHTEYNSTLYQGNNNTAESFLAVTPSEIGKHFVEIAPSRVWAKLFRRDLIEMEGLRFPINMHLGEDMYFTYSFLLKAKHIGKVADAYYRLQNINPFSLSKRYVENLEEDIERQITLWDSLVEKFPEILSAYYEDNVDLRMSLSAGFFNNLYKQDCTLSYAEKKNAMRKYLVKHGDWIKYGATGITAPKNTLQKITTVVLKTQIPWVIGGFFWCKEYLKKKKFEIGSVA